jgi:hypothetical protein
MCTTQMLYGCWPQQLPSTLSLRDSNMISRLATGK